MQLDRPCYNPARWRKGKQNKIRWKFVKANVFIVRELSNDQQKKVRQNYNRKEPAGAVKS